MKKCHRTLDIKNLNYNNNMKVKYNDDIKVFKSVSDHLNEMKARGIRRRHQIIWDESNRMMDM